MLKKNQINRQGEIIINLTVNGVEYDSGLKVPRDADFRWASQEIQKISNILPLNQYIEVQVCWEGFDLNTDLWRRNPHWTELGRTNGDVPSSSLKITVNLFQDTTGRTVLPSSRITDYINRKVNLRVSNFICELTSGGINVTQRK